MTNLPKLNTFVVIPFGAGATQIAHVEGHSRDGRRAKVRAFNRTQNHWMPGHRLVDAEDCTPFTGQAPDLSLTKQKVRGR